MTHTVRWTVDSRTFQRTFATAKLAESFRATLLVASRGGQPFDRSTGSPFNPSDVGKGPAWFEHACAFVDAKWPHVSARHRKSIAEGLMTATCAALPATSEHDAALLRQALQGWAFNPGARERLPVSDATPPEPIRPTIRWAQRHSPTVAELAEPARLRPVLDALAVKLDGAAAAPSTIARKRSALYSAFDYAVELGYLQTNPLDRLKWKAPAHTNAIDRRAVINPTQARELLAAVQHLYPSLEAFFACIYFAGMRPSEVRHLKVTDCHLPTQGWGTLHLLGSTQTSGSGWTDDGSATEDRQLKHRATRATRTVPAPPDLVTTLNRHIERFQPGKDGRVFVTRAGRAGVPVALPFAGPQSMGIVYRIWDLARREVFTDAEYASPLARRPYDLRHAAVSLWLNAGVSAPQVAEWAGHSVNVLLRVYASCIVGQDEAARQRVESALSTEIVSVGQPISPDRPETLQTSPRIPHGDP